MKKYVDFMNEISADELYKGLLAYGFFLKKFYLYLRRNHFLTTVKI